MKILQNTQNTAWKWSAVLFFLGFILNIIYEITLDYVYEFIFFATQIKQNFIENQIHFNI